MILCTVNFHVAAISLTSQMVVQMTFSPKTNDEGDN